ncbi:MAG: tetratricopeptide repeat protein [Acidobacteria bacterium]|nr:tetratricopeptide repeat protein [Acidobacteriota bacterium]
MKNISFTSFFLAVALLIVVAGGCGQKQGAEPPETTQPAPAPGQPTPMNAPFMQGQTTGPAEEGKTLPLKLTGLNSVEELNRGLAKLSDAESKRLFEEAFRKTFSTEQAGRNYGEAETEFKQVLGKNPKSAESYRGLGYAVFNQGQAQGALQYYLKAIEIDPNYGEAHYAVAFLYAMGDTAKGKEHYQKAMQLGIPDERKLGERFYK